MDRHAHAHAHGERPHACEFCNRAFSPIPVMGLAKSETRRSTRRGPALITRVRSTNDIALCGVRKTQHACDGLLRLIKSGEATARCELIRIAQGVVAGILGFHRKNIDSVLPSFVNTKQSDFALTKAKGSCAPHARGEPAGRHPRSVISRHNSRPGATCSLNLFVRKNFTIFVPDLSRNDLQA